jgi:hypothetical protein
VTSGRPNPLSYCGTIGLSAHPPLPPLSLAEPH